MLNQFWYHNQLSLAANLYFDRFFRTNLITDELDERLGRAVDHGVGHHSGLPERRPQGQPGEDVPEVGWKSTISEYKNFYISWQQSHFYNTLSENRHREKIDEETLRSFNTQASYTSVPGSSLQVEYIGM